MEEVVGVWGFLENLALGLKPPRIIGKDPACFAVVQCRSVPEGQLRSMPRAGWLFCCVSY